MCVCAFDVCIFHACLRAPCAAYLAHLVFFAIAFG